MRGAAVGLWHARQARLAVVGWSESFAQSDVWSALADQFVRLPADQVLDERNTARDCTGDPSQGEGPEEHDCGFDDGELRSSQRPRANPPAPTPRPAKK
jgi:hypothetical protein